MSTATTFRYPHRLVYGTVRESQETPEGFIAVIDGEVLTKSTPYPKIRGLLNRLAADEDNQRALELLRTEVPWAYEVVAAPVVWNPWPKRVAAAVRRLDRARLEAARQIAKDSPEYQVWANQLSPKQCEAFETPLDLVQPDPTQHDFILEVFRIIHAWERQLAHGDANRPKPKGPNRATKAKKAERRVRDQKYTERTKAGGKGNKVA